MFNVSKIRAKFYGVVGFRQPLNPAYAILDAANQVSRSSYFVTDNPYAKIEYLYDNTDYKDLTDPEFNTLLKQMQEESITNVMGRVFNRVDYIDRQVLYSNAQNRVETDTLTGGLITHRIQVSPDKNVAFEITRVLLDFSGSGDVKLMLFNTSQDTPLFTENITITSTHQEQVLNWVVDNSDDTYKGDYYLGYLSNDVNLGTLKPFKRDYNNSDIASHVTHLNIQKIQFVGHTTETLPDLDDEDGFDEATGINPDITVYDDFTDLIVQNERLFSLAISLDLQINVLSQYMASLRSNKNERQSERITLRVLQEIEGQEGEGLVKITGLRPQLMRSIKSISKEIERLREGYFGGQIIVDTLV